MKLTVSNKKLGLRIALTAIALAVAVFAFTYAVVRIGHKDPGYQTIEAKADAEALTYNKAVAFKYWFGGSSNEIKRGINALTEVYTPILAAAYKQLDHQNEYSVCSGIASLNRNLGSAVAISKELYSVLKDAYARTLENKGYNMFAGDLYAEWESILILDEPDSFDPVNNFSQASRISAIAATVSDLSNFSLEFLDDEECTVRFSVSEEYKKFSKDYEIESVPLNLNLLHDAYMLRWIADALYEEGCRTGYLYTSEGQVLCLGPYGTLGYDMYTLENGKETVYASVNLEDAFSATTFTAFGMGSLYGYRLGDLYRHLYFDVRTGDFTNILMSATLINPDTDLVETVYQSIILNTLSSENEVVSYASSLENSGLFVSYVFQSVGT